MPFLFPSYELAMFHVPYGTWDQASWPLRCFHFSPRVFSSWRALAWSWSLCRSVMDNFFPHLRLGTVSRPREEHRVPDEVSGLWNNVWLWGLASQPPPSLPPLPLRPFLNSSGLQLDLGWCSTHLEEPSVSQNWTRTREANGEISNLYSAHPDDQEDPEHVEIQPKRTKAKNKKSTKTKKVKKHHHHPTTRF